MEKEKTARLRQTPPEHVGVVGEWWCGDVCVCGLQGSQGMVFILGCHSGHRSLSKGGGAARPPSKPGGGCVAASDSFLLY